MQKLEEILRAEEAARHAVADARARATTLVNEADTAARALLDEERAVVAGEAAALSDRAHEAAVVEAARITDEALAAREAQLAAARGRLRLAAQAAIAVLAE